MRKIFIIIIFLITVVLFALLLFSKNSQIAITNFDECAQKYPVMESYPPSCSTPDGKRFTQNIGNELALSDSILISSPRPNQEIESPFVIQGKAKGSWFFEGQMSAVVYDSENKKIGEAILTADGEWMTEGFVPFSGILEFSQKSESVGKLIIKNANPSGLAENSRELIVPVLIR